MDRSPSFPGSAAADKPGFSTVTIASLLIIILGHVTELSYLREAGCHEDINPIYGVLLPFQTNSFWLSW